MSTLSANRVSLEVPSEVTENPAFLEGKKFVSGNGILVNSPETQYSGSLSVAGSMLDAAGTVKAARFEGDGSGLTGIKASKWADGTGGSINYSGGNVGIGANPSDKLDVAGNLRILTGTNPIRFTPAWSNFPDSVTNGAEISNDTSTYKTLMIIGNRSAGLGRRVSVWDRLEVNGTFITTGNVEVSGDIKFGGTISTSSRMHINGGEILYLLNKQGVIIGREWGGNGNLTVQGNLATNGNVDIAGNLKVRGLIDGYDGRNVEIGRDLNVRGTVKAARFEGNGSIQGNFQDLTDSSISKQLNNDSNRTVVWTSDTSGLMALVTSAPRDGTTTVMCQDTRTVLSAASGGGRWARTNYFFVVPGKTYLVQMDGRQGSVTSWILYK